MICDTYREVRLLVGQHHCILLELLLSLPQLLGQLFLLRDFVLHEKKKHNKAICRTVHDLRIAQTAVRTHRIELLKRGKVAQHTSVAIVPLLLLFRPLQANASYIYKAVEGVVARFLSQALLLIIRPTTPPKTIISDVPCSIISTSCHETSLYLEGVAFLLKGLFIHL